MSVPGGYMFEQCIVRMCGDREKISREIADLFVPADVNPSLGNRNNAIQFTNSFSISFIPINLESWARCTHLVCNILKEFCDGAHQAAASSVSL